MKRYVSEHHYVAIITLKFSKMLKYIHYLRYTFFNLVTWIFFHYVYWNWPGLDVSYVTQQWNIKSLLFLTLRYGETLGAMETTHYRHVSPRKCLNKRTHINNLMSSSHNLKLKRLYFNDYHSHGRSAPPPSLSKPQRMAP